MGIESTVRQGSNSAYIYFFKTKHYNFVLDIHTNRLFALEPIELKVLEKYIEGQSLEELSKEFPNEVSDILNLREQGLWCSIPPRGIGFAIDWDTLCEKILNERAHTIIEITQKCNLRCRYCAFSGGFSDHRTHSSDTMDNSTIIKAVDSAFNHAKKLQEISIGFYGGEPLCAFEQLKTAVLYAQKISKAKKLSFNITTNATLIDKEKAEFLRDYGFSVLVSIDGPKHMHNAYRIYADGTGSYSDTINGLRVLLDTYPKNLYYKIGINMVIPSLNWIESLEDLWKAEPWLPQNLRAQVALMDKPKGLIIENKQIYKESCSYAHKWFTSISENTKLKTTLGSNTFDKAMATLHQRPIFTGYRHKFFPNGCCIPAVRKIYVRVDGTYQICERAHGVPTIGSVTKGIDFMQIKGIVDEYCKQSFQDCKECWAISNCSLCFQHAYENTKFSISKKRRFCKGMRRSLSQNLKSYGIISNEYPYKVKEWESIEFK